MDATTHGERRRGAADAARAHRRHRRRADRAHARRAARPAGARARALAAVFDAHAETRARRRPPSSACRSPASVEELLGRPDVDAVAICTSTDTHADLIVAAARAGKAIFCEKPVSLDLDEVDRALAAVEAAGVPFQIGFNRRFDPAHAVGPRGGRRRPRRRAASRAHHQPRPRPAAARVRPRLGRDLPRHDRSTTSTWPATSPAARSSRSTPAARCASTRRSPRPATSTPRWSCSTHENGCLTAIDNSRQAVYGYDQRVEVFGSAGMAASENPLAHTGDRAHRRRARASATLPYFFLERYTPSYLREWEAFVAALAAGATPPVTTADARAPLVIGLAAVALAARGAAGPHRRGRRLTCARTCSPTSASTARSSSSPAARRASAPRSRAARRGSARRASS